MGTESPTKPGKWSIIAPLLTIAALFLCRAAAFAGSRLLVLALALLLAVEITVLIVRLVRWRSQRVRFRLLVSYGLLGFVPPVLLSFLGMIGLYLTFAAVQMVAVRRAAENEIDAIGRWARAAVPAASDSLPAGKEVALRWVEVAPGDGRVHTVILRQEGEDRLCVRLPYPPERVLEASVPLEEGFLAALESATGRRVSWIPMEEARKEGSGRRRPTFGLSFPADGMVIELLDGEQVRAEFKVRWRELPIVYLGELGALIPGVPSTGQVLIEDTIVSLIGRLGSEQDIPVRSILLGLLMAFVFAEIILVAVVMFVGDRIGRATDRLETAARRVAAGDFSVRVRVRARDQLGDLAHSFNEMVGDLAKLMKQNADAQRVEGEIVACATIQQGLLPPPDACLAGMTVAAYSRPARDVGGDLYDYFPLPNGKVALLVADVSGKGVTAALYMAELKGLLMAYADGRRAPADVIRALHAALGRTLRSGSFITMVYVEIDPQSGAGELIRAGHPNPLIAGPRGVREVAAEGTALGLSLIPDPVGTVGSFRIADDECLVLFTDGLTEATDAAGREMADGPLVAAAAAAAEENPGQPHAVRSRLLETLEAHPGHTDDVTVLVASRAPRAEIRNAESDAGRYAVSPLSSQA